MTGFGKATGTFKAKKFTVEIKSLNSKQFDASIKIPSLYREKELLVRNMLAEKLWRGKIDLNIHVESAEADKKVSINHELAAFYVNEIKQLGKEVDLPLDSSVLRTVLNIPEVLHHEKQDLDEEEWSALEALIADAIEKLVSFRKSEGESLERDIVSRIEEIESLRKEVESHLPERLNQVRERLQKNVKEIIEQDKIEQNRFEQEIIYYLEKLDITEEHTRLEGHCKYFLETIDGNGQVGKKLGFICQEIGREINTMGSKANYVAIQKLVVRMKDELEKIKEQLLNIA
jgi:uncharacterized protein (TIGR00255 family)